MKWSGPLPQLTWFTGCDLFYWAFGFGISFPETTRVPSACAFHFGPLCIGLHVTWPEKDVP